jgi:hypothetical protein
MKIHFDSLSKAMGVELDENARRELENAVKQGLLETDEVDGWGSVLGKQAREHFEAAYKNIPQNYSPIFDPNAPRRRSLWSRLKTIFR